MYEIPACASHVPSSQHCVVTFTNPLEDSDLRLPESRFHIPSPREGASPRPCRSLLTYTGCPGKQQKAVSPPARGFAFHHSLPPPHFCPLLGEDACLCISEKKRNGRRARLHSFLLPPSFTNPNSFIPRSLTWTTPQSSELPSTRLDPPAASPLGLCSPSLPQEGNPALQSVLLGEI